MMSDTGKFKALLFAVTAVVILIFAQNIFEDRLTGGMENYLKRRLYFEKVISKKALSLHRALYWKEEK